jgi:hypothetical protein
MPIFKGDEAIILENILLAHEVGECNDHDSVDHHLIKHSDAYL